MSQSYLLWERNDIMNQRWPSEMLGWLSFLIVLLWRNIYGLVKNTEHLCNVCVCLYEQVWNSYFSLAVLYINQPSLQLENLSPAKRKKVLDKWGHTHTHWAEHTEPDDPTHKQTRVSCADKTLRVRSWKKTFSPLWSEAALQTCRPTLWILQELVFTPGKLVSLSVGLFSTKYSQETRRLQTLNSVSVFRHKEFLLLLLLRNPGN